MSDLYDGDATDLPCLTVQGGEVCSVPECPCADLNGTLRSTGRARLLAALLTPQSAPCQCPRCAAKPMNAFCTSEAEAELAVGHVSDWPMFLLGLDVVEFTGAALCPACGGWAPEFADAEAVPDVPSVILAGGCPVH
ncbi:hypothetical protein [Williamsia herbipolensis]|uniref:hypothetical protein n=1 Tax=Williamsia herbipolensis TaxID=1603258 RepID=UPI0005F7C1E0|nr:hypothetical protein [Williamsia herbipolensis]